MKSLCLWVVLIIFLRTTQVAAAVKIVVIRDDAASESEEESTEKVSSDESKQIDMLMDFIEKEARGHMAPPVRTLRLLRKKKPRPELVSQHSFQTEKIQMPKLAKEYHVHYHSHQHKATENPSLSVNEDKITPVLWDTLSSHLNTFQDIYTSPRTPNMPLMVLPEMDRFKDFKDFETLSVAKHRSPETNVKYTIPDNSPEVADNFDETMARPAGPSSNKTNAERKLEMLKRYQALLNARIRPQMQYGDYLNTDRFAGFTDFSTIENPPNSRQRPQVPEADSSKNAEQEDLAIKDFAIVIKTKNRSPQFKKDLQSVNHHHQMSPKKVKMVRTMSRIPQETKPIRALSVPRILDAPGGAPQFLEKLNQLKHAKQILNWRHALPQTLNSIESQQRQRFLLRPVLRPNVNSGMYKGWLIQRVVR